MTGKEFRRRVEKEYQRHNPDKENAHGALSWFARIVDRLPKRVWTWSEAKRVPRGPHLRMLAIVERLPVGHVHGKWVNEPEVLGAERKSELGTGRRGARLRR